jgi:hypothetical protein
MSDVTKVFMSVIDKTPEAFVVIILLADPLVLGNVNSVFDATVLGACKDTSLELSAS